MSAKILPFAYRRKVTTNELEVYRLVTRNWTPGMRQLLFPHHFAADMARKEKK